MEEIKVKCNLRKIRLTVYMEDNKAKFARELNVEPHTYAKWESEQGMPTLKKALEVAKLLEMPIEKIWYLE